MLSRSPQMHLKRQMWLQRGGSRLRRNKIVLKKNDYKHTKRRRSVAGYPSVTRVITRDITMQEVPPRALDARRRNRPRGHRHGRTNLLKYVQLGL